MNMTHDHDRPMSPGRRRLMCGCAGLGTLLAWGVAGCGKPEDSTPTGPTATFGPDAACALDGMLLAEYPGPKGQIQVAGATGVEWYCDTLEVLSVLKRPEQVRALRGAWVQDMAQADWERPRGHWIDARTAVYVLGSRRKGSMGATAASFASPEAAQAFVAQWGGKALRFDQISADMADLSGGALHDTRM